MTTAYPTSLDNYTDPAPTDPLVGHAQKHTDLNDAVEALEGFVGVSGSAVAGTVINRLGTLEATHIPGTWNAAEGTYEIVEGLTVLHLGQEVQYYGKATEAISKGQIVMFAGAQGGHPLIQKADVNAVGFHPRYIMGAALHDFAINDFGYVVAFGYVHDVNTNAYAEGTLLYLDTATAGAFTSTAPVHPLPSIVIAAVLRQHLNQGTLLIRPDFGHNLEDAYNVLISSVSSDQVLSWDSVNLRWRNRTLPAGFDGVYSSLSGIPATFAPSAHSHPESDITGLTSDLAAKQETLVSGTNIKTVNGSSLLGAGNVVVGGAVVIYQITLDFGTVPVYSKAITFSDAAISATSKIIMVPDATAAGDSLEMDGFVVAVKAGTGNATVYIHAVPGPVTGTRVFNYTIG